MKLYTKKEVVRAIQLTVFDKPLTYLEVLDKLTPIELPSDEEIEKKSFIINPPKIQNDYGNDYDDNIQYRDEWLDGAKWVIEHIKQQDRDQ